jgi:hypothetical protein
MGTYLRIPPGHPAAPWLRSAGAIPVTTPPADLTGVPCGKALIAVVFTSGGFDAALLITVPGDLASARAADRPVTWLLMNAGHAAALAGGGGLPPRRDRHTPGQPFD